MNNPLEKPKARRSGTMAGGVFFAFGLIAGVVIGTLYGQPSIGMVAGAGIGLLLVALVWLIDRRR